MPSLSLFGVQAKVLGKPLNIFIGDHDARVAAAVAGALATVVIYLHGRCFLFFDDEYID